jgi:hypothetical protein
MMIVWVIGLLVLLAIAAPVIEWNWRRRMDRTRHKADYPLVDQYPPPQASAMQTWPWV